MKAERPDVAQPKLRKAKKCQDLKYHAVSGFDQTSITSNLKESL